MAYVELLNIISCDVSAHAVNFLTQENSWLYALLFSLTCNVSFCRRTEEERTETQSSLRFVFEFIIAWLVRLFNGKCWVLPIVLLSLWAWKTKVPKPFWALLCRWRMLYSKEKTEDFLTDLGMRISWPRNYPAAASLKVGLAVFDNCLCKFPTSFEGIREDGDGSVSYLFCNWLTVPVFSVDVHDSYDPLKDGKAALMPLRCTKSNELTLYAFEQVLGTPRYLPFRCRSGFQTLPQSHYTNVTFLINLSRNLVNPPL